MERNNIILDRCEREGTVVRYHFSVSPALERYFNSKVFFIDYGLETRDILESILSIPFVANFLAMAWMTNAVVWVNDLDRTFYDCLYALRESYQEIYHYFPLKGRVVSSVFSRNTISENNNENKALLLFSGGADAQTSFIRNLDKRPLLCNIQGWYESEKTHDKVADADFRDILSFAREYGLPVELIRCNFASLFNHDAFDKIFKPKLGDTLWHGFLHSIAFIAIAIPVAYTRGIKEIIIASSLTKGLNHLCASNSSTDSQFLFANSGYITHDGFELNRQGKIHIIAQYQKRLHRPFFMRVCSFHDRNCCECEKCFRTVLGLVAEGVNPEDFGFNITSSLKEHWAGVIDRRAQFMSFASEKVLHWPHIRKTMKDNYAYMTGEQQEFVDWFLSTDFDGTRKKAIRRYRIRNFFRLVWKRLKR